MPQMGQLEGPQGGLGWRCLCDLGRMEGALQSGRSYYSIYSLCCNLRLGKLPRDLAFANLWDALGDHKNPTRSKTNAVNSGISQHSKRRTSPTHPTPSHKEMIVLLSISK